MKKGLIILGAAIMCCTMAFGAKYVKVTDVTKLKAGDKVIMGSSKAAVNGKKPESASKYLAAVTTGVVFSNDTVTVTNTEGEITLGTITSGKDGYNKPYIKTTLTIDGNVIKVLKDGTDLSTKSTAISEFMIQIDDLGNAIITNQNQLSTQPYFRYNSSGSGRFACYTSTTQAMVELYLLNTGDPSVHVESVTIDKQTATVLEGGQVALTATVLPETAGNKNVTWSSDNQAVATVTDGVVTAVAEGKANIIVTTEDGGKKDTCVVTVKGVLPDTKMYRITDIKQQLVDSAWICFGSLDDTTKVMGTYESGNNIKPMEVTINEDGTLNVGAKALYGVEVNISTDTTYAFIDSNSKYIYAASTSSNHLKAQDAVYYWKVEIDEEGDLVKSVTNSSRGVLRYNESSDIFSCYQSFGSQKHIILYSSIKATDTPTAVVNVNDNDNHNVQKVIRNGRVVIVRDGVEYDLMGGRL